jgi:hypothetical protein
VQTIIAPPPDKSPIAIPGGWISSEYYRWLTVELVARLQLAPQVLKALSLTAQGATIPATTLITAPKTSLYRVDAYLRITQAATTNSSATLTLSWTDGGVVQSKTFAAVTGNTTTTIDSQSLFLHADGGTVITYAVVYASTGATAMQFRLDLDAEQRN